MAASPFDSRHGLPSTPLGTGWPWARSGFRPIPRPRASGSWPRNPERSRGTGGQSGATGYARRAPRVIALLSDFGTRDWYVAMMKGVLLSRAPTARLVDVTHEIPPQDVLAGALVLRAAMPWFPDGSVFLAVVDPGVGSTRAILAVKTERHYLIGPDNGLLAPSVEEARYAVVRRLTNHRLWMAQPSSTFHGRDIMAPVAAYLAQGGAFSRVGEVTERMEALKLPLVQRAKNCLRGQIMHLDAFGNLITNLSVPSLVGAKRHPMVRYQERHVRVVASYAESRPNELVAIQGSLGLLELAIREGSAAWAFNAKRGDPVELRWHE